MQSPLHALVLTFNCAREPVDSAALASQIFPPSGAPAVPELVVLCLQEIAPVSHSFLGNIPLTSYFNALRHAVQLAGPADNPYQEVAIRHIGMTAIAVFAASASFEKVSHLATAGVGFGLADMGNKGAVGVRLAWSAGTAPARTLTFVSAHLAPMESAIQERNLNWRSTVERLVFRPAEPSGSSAPIPDGTDAAEAEPLLGHDAPTPTKSQGIFASDSMLFFAGDLNYRTRDVKPGPEQHRTFPQAPHQVDALRPTDQLQREHRAARTLHGLAEEPLSFPPTYKYDRKRLDEQLEYPWAKHRYPSWCDRILFSAALQGASKHPGFRVHRYDALPIQTTSDHRPVVLDFEVDLEGEIWDQLATVEPPFPIDADWEGKRKAARRLEIAVGAAAYLTTTTEGLLILAALGAGALGGYLALSSMLM